MKKVVQPRGSGNDAPFIFLSQFVNQSQNCATTVLSDRTLNYNKL